MDPLTELYQEVILDHNKRPRNTGELPLANHTAEGHNPLCGDQLRLYLVVADGRIQEIRFHGQGCAISTAAASLMTEEVKGKTVVEAEALFERFHAMLTGDPATAGEPPEGLGKLAVFSGVREFPIRVKCATLPWHTLQAALAAKEGVATSE